MYITLIRYRLLVVALATESLALVTVVVVVLMASGPLGALGSLASRHVGSSLSETTDGSVGVELHLLTEAILLLLSALHLQPLVSPPSSTAVVLLPELITDLAPTSSAAKLTALLVPRIEIATNDALIQLRAGDVAQAGDSLGMEVVLYKRKAAWCSAKSASLSLN